MDDPTVPPAPGKKPRKPIRGRKRVPWREDLVILNRLPEVERMHLGGKKNSVIARTLDLDESTIRKDLKHLKEIWLERIGDEVVSHRSQIAAELVDVKNRALAAAEFDEACELAVLFGLKVTLPDGTKPAGVVRDGDGKAQFRGNKSAALTTARQAIMDRAKILGVVIDKTELSGDGAFLDALRQASST